MENSITNLISMMRKVKLWAGYHVSTLMHMGKRTSNRVEAMHANTKCYTKTSSESLAIVSEKIKSWAQKRVGCHYFNILYQWKIL